LNLLDTTPVQQTKPARDPSRYNDVFIEIERAKLDLLRVTDTIAAAKRNFFENGVSMSAADRNTLYAEQRRLELAVQALKVEALELKTVARDLKGKSFVEGLVRRLELVGRADLVEEARAESLEALEASGLRLAYSMKGPA
jgi:hypothetical protein